jgi:hypothetical protein
LTRPARLCKLWGQLLRRPHFSTIGAFGIGVRRLRIGWLQGGRVSTISTTISQGITLGPAASPGTYTSPLTITSSGAVRTTSGDAIYGPASAAWTVQNYGSVTDTGTTGSGIELLAGGYISNIGSSALIQGYNGIDVTGTYGTVVNSGTIKGSLTTGNNAYGVRLNAGGTVFNTGSILSPKSGYSVRIALGYGYLSNSSTGYIGVGGALLASGGTAVNAGRIISIGGPALRFSAGGGTINNSGTLIGTSAGGIGVLMFGNSTLVNSGSISGNATAVYFGGVGYSALLELAPGYSISGKVVASGASKKLELLSAASTGTISGIPSKFATFGTIAVDSGARWVLSGANTIASGVTMSLLGTLTDTGALTNAGRILASTGTFVIDPATLVNSGYVSGTVTLSGGGAVTNQAGGTIKSTGIGVFGTLAAATVSNAGSILGGAAAYGVTLAAGGSVANTGTGRITGVDGVGLGAAGTVTNASTIIGTAYGVVLLVGGSVANNSGLIQGQTAIGVYVGGAAGTVTNAATIIGGGSRGIELRAGGTVVNTASGLIEGGTLGAVYASNATGTVSNSGTILGIGAGGLGVLLATGGRVTNTASGLIEGAYGVKMANAVNYGTVINYGSIIGTTNRGVYLQAGNVVTNGTSGVIQGANRGVEIGRGFFETLDNSGTISGTTDFGAALNVGTVNNRSSGLIQGAAGGIYINSGGVVNAGTVVGSSTAGTGVRILSAAGAVSNSGSIIGGTADDGVHLLAGGSVTNSGTGRIQGHSGIVIGGAAGTVDNSATVVSTSTGTKGSGVYLGQGGNLTNELGGLITASRHAISVAGAAATIVNLGTLQTTGTFASAVFSGVGATLTNSGVITSTAGGIDFTNVAATVNNSGSIISTLPLGGTVHGAGVYLGSGGLIINQAAGVINALRGGVSLAFFGTTSAAATVSNLGVIIGGGYGISVGAADSGSNTIVNSGTIVGSSGTAISFGGTGANLLVLEHGYKITGSVVGAVGASDTVELAGSVGNAVTASFNGLALTNFSDVLFGSGGFDTLKVSNTAGTVPIVLSGFTLTSDAIDLTGIGSGAITQNDTANHRVTVSGVGGTVTLQFDASDSTVFATGADGSGGTLLLVCFCRGTRIATERGEVPVEELSVGDRVKTWSGAHKPIEWIGFGRDLVTAKHTLSRPIIVRAGALADNVPHRDLYLTHGHALYVDGVLIPVENLVNHRSIVWDEEARVVEYYHLELADHDVVFAEGAPAETYYDADNRAQFHNVRPGSAAADAAPTFAPVLNGGDLVDKVWMDLFERAGGRIEDDTTADPDLHLVSDGERLDPAEIESGRYTFALAAPPCGSLLLRSRSGVPSQLGITRHDHRRLGVAISRIELRDAATATEMTHDAWLFGGGSCHPAESEFAWTDGEFALPAALFAHLRGAVTVTIHTERCGAMRYPLAAPVADAA